MEKYQSENIEAIWVELSLCSQKMLIGTVYRPPDRDDFYTLFPPILEQIWQTRKNLLIIGDLNSDLTLNGMNDKGRRLKTKLNNYNLKNMIKDPTRETETTKSVLDLVIVNDASKVTTSGVQDICIADHKLVYLKYTLKRSKSKPKIITVKNYKRLDEKAFKNDIENAPWWVCTTFDDIDDMIWCWSKMYESIVDVHIKKRRAKIRVDSLPWIDSQIRKMMNYRYKLLRKCDGTPRTSNEWNEYRRVKNEVRKLLRKAEARYWREQFSEVTCKQDFWKVYKKVTNKGNGTKIGPLKSKEGELWVCDKKKAEVMNEFYANIGREISQTFTQNNSKEFEHFYRITPTVKDPSYDRDALLKQLRKINPHKASGPDSVTSRELKILQGSIVNSLEIILKSSFQQSVFPSCWKIARIKPSFKKGKKQERTNYRPLSMLSIPSKLLESQICNTVDSHLEDNKIVTDMQWGFIKGRSTEGILLKLTEIWKKSVDNGLIAGIVFIVFQKAFDTVSHEILSYKLQAAGISENLHALIMNYLKDRTQYAEINGECSSTKHVRFGVPQGSLLGPKLYSLRVNDLPSAITQGEMYLFADDTTAYCTGKDLESVVDTLNTIMDEIHGWCIRNKLKVHPGKCEAMFMMRSPFIGPMRPILYGGDHIKIVQESTCLGLRIDNRLDWKSQVHNACKTFSKKLGALKRMRRLPTKVFEEIYYTTIIARTTYCI